MHTARLPTVHVSVATTRCQCQWGRRSSSEQVSSDYRQMSVGGWAGKSHVRYRGGGSGRGVGVRAVIMLTRVIWWYFPLYVIKVNFNPFFALNIFICSFRKCIQHTTRGQSNFPWSKLCCCYIFIVLKYWWQNSITAHIYANCDQGIVTRSVKKRGKRSNEGSRGIIFLLYWPRQQA